MKYTTIILALALTTTIYGQDKSGIIQAIGSGDTDRLGQFLDKNVEVCFDEKVEFLSKDRAQASLGSFFSKNPPQSFRSLHKGNSKSRDSRYDIGEYRSVNGKIFRVYIFAKELGTSIVIQELRFDTQK